MAKKEFTYRGKSLAELKAMSIQEFMVLIPSNERRKLKRGYTEEEKNVMQQIKAGKNNIETHCRDLIIVPSMVGLTIKVHSGKEFVPVMITEELLGHRLGEFSLTRRTVRHGAAGIGATRGSASQSVH